MAVYDVVITFDGTKFQYRDKDGDATTVPHAKKKESIRWKLKDYGASLDIEFNKDGNPFNPSTTSFTAPTNKWTDTGKFNDKHNRSYSYSVTARDAHGAILHQEDPQIMFDDAHLETEEKLFEDTLDKVAKSADAAWGALFSHLKDAANLKGDPERIFFPKGISLISVEVDAGVVKVIIKVAGSDAPSGGLAERE